MLRVVPAERLFFLPFVNLFTIQAVCPASTPIYNKRYLVFSWFCLLAKGMVLSRTLLYFLPKRFPAQPQSLTFDLS